MSYQLDGKSGITGLRSADFKKLVLDACARFTINNILHMHLLLYLQRTLPFPSTYIAHGVESELRDFENLEVTHFHITAYFYSIHVKMILATGFHCIALCSIDCLQHRSVQNSFTVCNNFIPFIAIYNATEFCDDFKFRNCCANTYFNMSIFHWISSDISYVTIV